MNNSTGIYMDVPPKHLFSDYIEIVYLATALIIGIPINVYILMKLFRNRRQAQDNSIKASFLLLNINLNISDLLILLIIAFGKICWIITYSWFGGEFLCKSFHFLSAFALYISSNIVVCIALDRLRNVIAISKIRAGKKVARTVKWSIITSWILAAVWSLPQFLVWQTLNVYPEYPGGWIQCSDIWSIEKFKHSVQHSEDTQTLYNISHLVLVFWGPLLVMMISYIFIAVRLLHYSMTDPCRKQESSKKIAEIKYSSSQQSACPVPSISDNEIRKLDVSFNQKGMIDGQSDYSLKESKPIAKQSIAYYFRKVCCSEAAEEEVSETSLYQICVTTSPQSDETKVRSKREPLLQPQLKHQPKHHNHSGTVALKRPSVPVWRRQLRSRVFRTTLLVVITHITFWFPYNLYSIMRYFDLQLFEQMSEHANVFKDLQIVIALVNPFLYGFSS